MNRDNLEKLASYLEALPVDYNHFHMNVYLVDDEFYHNHADEAPLAGTCGTVACAVGHGPAAGIAPLGCLEWWSDYARRVFDLTHREHYWCFDGNWSQVDNTPHGAAKRIRHMLEHGAPFDLVDQLAGDAPYLFAQETAA